MSVTPELVELTKALIPAYETSSPRTIKGIALWAIQAVITVGLALLVLWFLFEVLNLTVSLGG